MNNVLNEKRRTENVNYTDSTFDVCRLTFLVFRFSLDPCFIVLVLRRVLRAIDDEHLDRRLLRFQLQPELFLHGGEDRGTIRIDGRRAD